MTLRIHYFFHFTIQFEHKKLQKQSHLINNQTTWNNMN